MMKTTITIIALLLSFSLVSPAQNWVPCDMSQQEAVKAAFSKESASTRVDTWQLHFDNYVAQHVFTMNTTQLDLMSYGLQAFVPSGDEITDEEWLEAVDREFTAQERYEIFETLPEYQPTSQQIANELAEQELRSTPRCHCGGMGTAFECGYFTTASCQLSSVGWPCTQYRQCGLFNLQTCYGTCYTVLE